MAGYTVSPYSHRLLNIVMGKGEFDHFLPIYLFYLHNVKHSTLE